MVRERLRAALHIERMNLYIARGHVAADLRPETGRAAPRRPPRTSGRFRRKVRSCSPRRACPTPATCRGGCSPPAIATSSRCATAANCRACSSSVRRRGEEPLSRDDLHLIGTLTAPVALAIENSRLYGKLRRQLDEIRALKEYNENIIESSLVGHRRGRADGTVLTANRAFWELVGADHSGEIDRLALPAVRELHRTQARSTQPSISSTGTAWRRKSRSPPARSRHGRRRRRRARARHRRHHRPRAPRARTAGQGAPGVARSARGGRGPRGQHAAHRHLVLRAAPPGGHERRRSKYRLLKKMEQQTFRASSLVNNLLDFIANRPRTRELVNVEDLITATVALHETCEAEAHHRPSADGAASRRQAAVRVRGNFARPAAGPDQRPAQRRDAVDRRRKHLISVAEAATAWSSGSGRRQGIPPRSS